LAFSASFNARAKWFSILQGVAREFLEVPIRPILDLVLEERSVALLILDLATK
jgi:hypothetical protein